MSTLKQTLTDAMKASMKSGDKKRLGVIRLMLAAIKQIEVDTREELDDAQVLAVLDKMVKQRRDSATQYTDAGRDELAEQENYEITVLQDFLPEALGDEEIDALIKAAVAETGASAMQDMGKVMGILKAQVQGRADMGAVSGKIKAILTA
ncbi:MAG: GatB/YqeY domain-containing protein [Gammaproteobacteria bacterium]|nr:GatB/YqeY domain-containing protein [Gammaproteobacteria bacterium]